MTFTFDPSLADDVSYIRFFVGDTSSEGYYLEDETIQFLFDDSESYEQSIVDCIQFIITQLSSPNFHLDWMSVSVEQAREGYEKLLKEKKIEFGIQTATASATISLPHRADSDDYADEDGNFVDPSEAAG